MRDRKEYGKQWRQQNEHRLKEWRLNNHEYIKSKNKRYRIKHSESIKERNKQYVETIEGKFCQWKNSARKRHIPFSLTIEDLEQLPLICHYTGMPLTFEIKSYYTVSLDRLDSSKGYTKDNVAFCCGFINKMKQELTVEQFIMACRKVVQHHDSKN